LKGTWSDKSERAKQEGIETDPPLINKECNEEYTHTNLKHTHTINFVQINLYHSKAAMANLCQQLAEGKAGVLIVLIQESWTYRGK
jgi:hypothetical protein